MTYRNLLRSILSSRRILMVIVAAVLAAGPGAGRVWGQEKYVLGDRRGEVKCTTGGCPNAPRATKPTQTTAAGEAAHGRPAATSSPCPTGNCPDRTVSGGNPTGTGSCPSGTCGGGPSGGGGGGRSGGGLGRGGGGGGGLGGLGAIAGGLIGGLAGGAIGAGNANQIPTPFPIPTLVPTPSPTLTPVPTVTPMPTSPYSF